MSIHVSSDSVAIEAPDPQSGPGTGPPCTPRRLDVDLKQARVAEFLDDEGYEALLLARPDNFAWFTSGGDSTLGAGGDQGYAAVFATRQYRCILTCNVHSSRIFEEEVPGLGFDLKESRWYEPSDRMSSEICRGRKVASDLGIAGTPNLAPRIARLRWVLTDLERQRLVELGAAVGRAVESTGYALQPGQTEREVAGALADRLFREGIVPVWLAVMADDRPAHYRLAPPSVTPVRHRCVISLAARRHGLCVSLSRTVCFGAVDKEFEMAHAVASMVDATLSFFSRPGELAATVFRRGKRIYEKMGQPHEWMLNPQGGLIGYAPRELLIGPDCSIHLHRHQALAWSPGVAAARSEDTILIDDAGFVQVTVTPCWPRQTISVKGVMLVRPAILKR